MSSNYLDTRVLTFTINGVVFKCRPRAHANNPLNAWCQRNSLDHTQTELVTPRGYRIGWKDFTPIETYVSEGDRLTTRRVSSSRREIRGPGGVVVVYEPERSTMASLADTLCLREGLAPETTLFEVVRSAAPSVEGYLFSVGDLTLISAVATEEDVVRVFEFA